MKFNRKNATLFLAILGLGLSASCSKDQKNDGSITDGKTALVVDLKGVSGISEAVNSGNSSGSLLASRASATAQIKHQIVSEKTYSGDADFFIQQEEYELLPPAGSKQLKASANQAAVPYYPDGFDPVGTGLSRSLEDGITYRMIVYKASDNSFVGESTATVGQSAPRIVVDHGVAYKWYAYSYNSKDALSAFNPTNTEVEVKNSDLLYASGTISANVVGDNKVPITFSHKMAMLEVVAYTIGYSSEPNLAKFGAPQTDADRSFVNVPNIRAGNFDLLAGDFVASSITNLTAYSETLIQTKSASNAHLVDSKYPNTSIRGYVYSVPSASNINTNVAIRLGIKVDYRDSTRFIAPTNPVAINGLKLTAGRLSRLVVMPLERGISVSGSSGNTIWAKGYLYQHSPSHLSSNSSKWTQEERYLWMRHTPPQAQLINPSNLGIMAGFRFSDFQNLSSISASSYDARKYFHYHTKYPRSRNGDLVIGIAGDPCASTYAPMAAQIGNVSIPRNWRLPTLAEGTALATAINNNPSNNRITFAGGLGTSNMILTHYTTATAASTADGWYDGGLVFTLDGYYKNDGRTDYTPIENFDGLNGIQGFRGTPYVSNANVKKGASYIWLQDPQGFRTTANGAYPSAGSQQGTFQSKVLRIMYDDTATPKVKADIFDMPYLQAVPVRCVRVN